MASGEGDEEAAAGTVRVTVAPSVEVRRFRLVGAIGDGRAIDWSSEKDTCSIGSHPSNDLVLEDPAASRFHCELSASSSGVRVRDLGSKNGTILDGVTVVDAYCRAGSTLTIGRTTLRLELDEQRNHLPLSARTELGSLVGTSAAMRGLFALIELVAATPSTVLIEGETGTGKEGAAEAIHLGSGRAGKPFVVVDCGAIPPTLIESELFGHERGAFTGASARQTGAFEEASGGTLFLDEIGELDLEMQPKLLRVLERREIRRVGSPKMLPVDVRVIAATHRDLRAEVNAGRFRADLYYRLAVVKLVTPPLRERPEDLPALVESFLARLDATDEQRALLTAEPFLASLRRAAWPGNVRELRNHIERCLVFHAAQPVEQAAPAPATVATALPADWASLSYEAARRRALDEFEVTYVRGLLDAHGGKVANAARTAEVDRAYLYRLMRKHRVQP